MMINTEFIIHTLQISWKTPIRKTTKYPPILLARYLKESRFYESLDKYVLLVNGKMFL